VVGLEGAHHRADASQHGEFVMALTAEAQSLLADLEEAVDQWAEAELLRLTRRANLLRRRNTRIDDFAKPIEIEQARLVVTDIDSILS